MTVSHAYTSCTMYLLVNKWGQDLELQPSLGKHSENQRIYIHCQKNDFAYWIYHCLERLKLIREIGQQESCEIQHGQMENPVYGKEYRLGSSFAEKDLGVLIGNTFTLLSGILLVWIRLTASWGLLTGGITDTRLREVIIHLISLHLGCCIQFWML